jgi:hypothetical protein
MQRDVADQVEFRLTEFNELKVNAVSLERLSHFAQQTKKFH